MRSTWSDRTRTGRSGSVASMPAPCRKPGHAAWRTEGEEKLTAYAHQATSKCGSAGRTDSKSSSPVSDAPSVSTFTVAKSPWASTTGRPANRAGKRSTRPASAVRSVAASPRISSTNGPRERRGGRDRPTGRQARAQRSAAGGRRRAAGPSTGRSPGTAALEPRVARLRNGDPGQGLEDDPRRVGGKIGLADARNRDAGLGRRSPQRSHHPQPAFGILTATVPLHHHAIPGGKRDDIGAVRESPDGPLRVGDRSREHALDRGTHRTVRHHRPTLGHGCGGNFGRRFGRPTEKLKPMRPTLRQSARAGLVRLR